MPNFKFKLGSLLQDQPEENIFQAKPLQPKKLPTNYISIVITLKQSLSFLEHILGSIL